MPKRALLLNSAGFELTDESHADQSSDDFEILSHLEVERKPKSIAPPLRGAWTPTPTPTTSGSEGATPSPDKTPRSQNTKSKPKSTSQVKVEGESSASPSAKRVKRADKSDKKGTKTRWNADEDALLISMMEDVVNQHLWDRVKAEGSLVHRTGYGCKYHALLRQGTGKPPGKN